MVSKGEDSQMRNGFFFMWFLVLMITAPLFSSMWNVIYKLFITV